MKKVLITVATVFIALTTMLSSSADAGFRVGIGFSVLNSKLMTPHRSRRSSHRRRNKRKYKAAKRRRAKQKAYAKKRRAKRKVYAKQRSTKRRTIAKVKKAPKAAPVIDTSRNENSTISTAMVDTAEYDTETTFEAEEPVTENTAEVTADAVPVADTGNQLSCKKFFPAVGMTLTVPCE